MNRKFVTVLMAACLIVTLFAGCGGKDQDALSTGPNAGVSPTQEPGTAAGADAAIPGESQNVDEQAGGTDAAEPQGGNAAGTTAKGSGGQTTAKKSSGASSTTTKKNPSGGSGTTKPSDGGSSEKEKKAEIVSYFNTAANKVKTGKPALTYTTTGKMSAFGLSDGFSDDGSTRKGQNLDQRFPVIGQSWASKLPASAVKSAERTLSNGVYTLKITMNDEKDVLNIGNSAHGKVFFFMDTEQLKEMMKESGLEVERLTNNFSGSTITCTIDAKTGNMLSATYVSKDKINTYLKDMSEPLPIQMNITQQFKMAW